MEKSAGSDNIVNDLQSRRLALSVNIRELRLEARKLDSELHRVGGAGAMISCW